MKIIITEPTDKENTKSVGCWFIESAVKKAGHNIEYIEYENIKNTDADIYLFSVHHVKDIFYLAKLFKYKKGIWIGGGHVMNNPYPFLHFFDLICVGEGETWIVEVLNILSKGGSITDTLSIQGSLSLENINQVIKKRYESDISANDKYLNISFAEKHKDTWYMEIARGCKSKCYYCELGWTNKYRENRLEKIKKDIDEIAMNCNIKRVNIFAPDDYSASFYDEVIDEINNKKLITNFGSMRVDRLSAMNRKQKKNFLFRMGIDGTSERIRTIVNKKTRNEDIEKLFSEMTRQGYVMFKYFFIFSYPFETISDFNEFIYLMKQLKNIVKNNEVPVFLRLKFTPLIPNLYTPFEDFKPFYNKAMRENIELFFLREKQNRSNIVFINDGIMEYYSYYTQAFLSRAKYEEVNIDLLLNKKKLNFMSDKLAQKTEPNRKIEMYITAHQLDLAKNKLKRRINELQNHI